MANASSLFAGLHFDRKRFSKDIALFETKRPQHASPSEGGEEAAVGSRALADARTNAAAEENLASVSGRKMEEVERVALLRKQHQIHVSSRKAPTPLETFAELASRLGCPEALVQKLEDMGLRTPTPIQRQAIPLLLQGQECFACAPTGSGKTLAYGIPIVHSLKRPSKEGIRALVLSPTRELATQIARELKRVAEALQVKVRLLTKVAARCNDLLSSPGCDILVATPLRLCSLLGDSPKITLSLVRHLVLDEADKLFEMGFVEQIDKVVAACSSADVVKSLFSATLPETVERLAHTIMHDPVRVTIGERNAAASTVKQELLFVGSEEGKMLAMRHLIKEGVDPPVLVFVQSKERAQHLHKRLLMEEGLTGVGVIHADRTQSQRDKVVEEFRAGSVWMLIATDLMGRGMDFKGVSLVINFDFPPSTSSYVHRVGRSGRAGRRGRAITFHTEEDKDSLRTIAHVISASGTEVPQWMLDLPKVRRKQGRGKGQGRKGGEGEEAKEHKGEGGREVGKKGKGAGQEDMLVKRARKQ